MKKNYRKLQLIFRFTDLKPEMFYSIDLTNYQIRLQTEYDSSIVIFCKEHKFSHDVTENGMIYFTKGNLRIVLTD